MAGTVEPSEPRIPFDDTPSARQSFDEPQLTPPMIRRWKEPTSWYVSGDDFARSVMPIPRNIALFEDLMGKRRARREAAVRAVGS